MKHPADDPDYQNAREAALDAQFKADMFKAGNVVVAFATALRQLAIIRSTNPVAPRAHGVALHVVADVAQALAETLPQIPRR